jgi:hypothetical protein
MRLFGYGSWIVAGMLVILGSQGARASFSIPPSSGISPNYDLGSAGPGYLFDTWGGTVNPGLIVGFNPQPDPPIGWPSPTLSIFNQTQIQIVQTGFGQFGFVIAFPGLTGLLLPAVDKPNSDGITSLSFTDDNGNVFNVGLAFAGPGDAGSWTWGAFNPQPDPPGVWAAYQITFAGGPDPSVSLTLQENGKYLNLGAAPEPSTWAMMLIGFAGLGLAGRRASRKRSPLDA